MWEFLFKRISEYFATHPVRVGDLPKPIRRFVLLLQRLGRRLLPLILQNFLLIFLTAVVAFSAYVVLNPEKVFSTHCYLINMKTGEVEVSKVERKCQPAGSTIAIAAASPTGLGSIYFNDASAFPELNADEEDVKNLWSQKYMTTPEFPVLNHGWVLVERKKYENFPVSGCSLSPNTPQNQIETRLGLLLRTTESRPMNKALTRPEWEMCNKGWDDPKCQRGHFEILLPSISTRWCLKRNFVDYWKWLWKWKTELSDRPPKLCGRGVTLVGEPLPEHPWEEWGTIVAVWCD
jgi:hypothetical protein